MFSFYRDSAHRIHPLAGQGVNLGFGDCEVLSEIINQAYSEGADIGSMLYLKDYESRRQLKNLPVMLTMDFLNRLYRNDFSILVAARSLGLNFTNYSAFMKKFIMQQASIH
uniref:Uncharacterized protein n=1 Tax=Romanomermis culicivorax TaxID=13658 RepID=A0A915L604_ROMCU